MATLVTYSLTDFETIMFNGFNYQLPEETLAIIRKLAEQVGAPEYVKTPNFAKMDNGANGAPRRRRRNQTQEINDEDWEIIRKYQATKIKEKEGIDKSIDLILKALNKMTDDTYEVNKVNIIAEIKNIGDTSGLDKIGSAIFTVASGNIFYSKIYALLYKELMEEFEFMGALFEKNYNKFRELFKTIDYCSPDDDYNRFCEINKENDTRRAICIFYVNLMKNRVLTPNQIIDIIIEAQELLKRYMEEDEINKVEELAEIIFSLVTNSYNQISDSEQWDQIFNDITSVSLMHIRDKPSISNKTIFKHMDIIEVLEDSLKRT